ncbi:MAG: hypothetical protein HFI30_02450 [Lachnospiraceae bacterium]|jgi:hypothetical protein|nr:hypothetical protein [Lachnospiraceae bacterium]
MVLICSLCSCPNIAHLPFPVSSQKYWVDFRYAPCDRRIPIEFFISSSGCGIPDIWLCGQYFMLFSPYIVGAYYGMHTKESSNAQQLKYVLAMLFTAMLLEGLYDGFLHDITGKMMPILLLYLFPVIPCMKDRKIYKLSFLIYAIHHPIISDVLRPLRKLFSALTPYACISNIGTRVICLGIDFVIAGILYYFLQKFAPKVLSLLTGGRAFR